MLNRIQKILILSVTCCAVLLATVAIRAPRFLLFENGIARNDYLSIVLYPTVAMFVLLLLPFLAAKLFPGQSEFDVVWIRRPYSKIRWLLLLFSATFGLHVLAGVISYHVDLGQIHYYQFHDVTKLSLPFFILTAVIRVGLTPIAEEVFWRGFVQEQFAKCFNAKLAIVFQAVLFALMHNYPLFSLFHMFVFGLIMGYWRFKRRSLVPIILAHAAINGLWCLGHLPDQYEMSRKKISVNYVELINQAASSYPAENNAVMDYEKAIACYAPPPEGLRIYGRNVFLEELTAPQHESLTNWLQQNTEALEFFRKGSLKPCYLPHYIGNAILEAENYQNQQQLQKLACGVLWNAKLCSDEHNFETAMDEIVCAFRFGSHLLNGPKSYSSFLSGLSIHTLACVRASQLCEKMGTEELRIFQTRLQGVFGQYPSTLDLTWEKYSLYDSVQRIFTDEGNGNGHIPRAEIKGQDFDMLRLLSPGVSDEQIKKWKDSDRKDTTTMIDELFGFYADVFPQTPRRLQMQGISLTDKTVQLAVENILWPYICDMDLIYQSYHRINTANDALLTTIAILRYQHISGKFLENLEMLVSDGLMERVPMDPYSDRPLIYKADGSGFVLYSVGADFQDDGGMHKDDWGKNGGDYVFWPMQTELTRLAIRSFLRDSD